VASEAVINVPFSETILSVLAQGWEGCAQARDLMTHPIVEQLRHHFLEQHRAATKAARICGLCCHRMFFGCLGHVKLSRSWTTERLSNSRQRYPDRELFHRGGDNT
jgi:hypothetical protein